MAYSRNEVKAGIMILVSIAALTVMIFLAGNYKNILKPKTHLKVAFKDVKGLKTGSPVLYAGVEIGKVKRIEVRPSATEGERSEVVLDLEISSDFPVPGDSAITIAKTVTDKVSVQIRPGVGETPAGETVVKGKELPGLEELAEKGEALVKEGRVLMADGHAVLQKLGETMDKVNATWGTEQQASVKKIVADMEATSASARKIAEDVGRLTGPDGQLAATLNELKSASATVRSIVESNRDGIAEVVSNAKSATADMKGAIASIDGAAKQTREVLDSAAKLIGDAEGIVDDSRPNIERSVSDVKMTTENLKAAAEDLRRHPWKLLKSQKPKELETQNLYDASRQLNEMSARLDESLDKLLAATQGAEGTPKANLGDVRKVVAELKEIIAKLEETSAKLDKKGR
ncbi:MAG: MCE family protein [Planctomycetes bacterium]|nr:MCE family protein [Planctomycetota bacterium]